MSCCFLVQWLLKIPFHIVQTTESLWLSYWRISGNFLSFFQHLFSECVSTLLFLPFTFFFWCSTSLFALNSSSSPLTLFSFHHSSFFCSVHGWTRMRTNSSLSWMSAIWRRNLKSFLLFMASYKILCVSTVTTTRSSSFSTFLQPWTIKKSSQQLIECIKLCDQRLDLNDDDVGWRSDIFWLFVISSFRLCRLENFWVTIFNFPKFFASCNKKC